MFQIPGLRPTLAPRLRDSPLAPAAAFETWRATEGEDWRGIRALRYAVLRARDEIAECREREFGDAHDASGHAATFVLVRGGALAASTRASAAAPGALLPADDAFARELEPLRRGGGTVVEASLTVVDPAPAMDARAALLHLMKLHMLHCEAWRADWMVLTVPEARIGFWRRLFNMEILSGAERCPGYSRPRVLMGLRYGQDRDVVFRRVPELVPTAAEQREFDRAAMRVA